MYRIKRFSQLLDRLFANNLSNIREVIGRYEGSLVSHILMYIDAENESIHWSGEITRFITSEGIPNLDKKKVKNISYRELFPYYLGKNMSKRKDAIKTATDKIREEKNESILYLIDVLKSDLLLSIITYFSNELDKLKSKIGMIQKSDRDKIEVILNKLRSEYRQNLISLK